MSRRANRRLAAMVAADVVGYSRLVGADEEATLSALKRHRHELIDPLLSEHGGRVANTAGDSLLIEFASVVDAVRCAIALQHGMAARNDPVAQDRRVVFRIGIHVGDVVAEGDDLLGDGVNIAARLETLCGPGDIALSDDAYRQVRDRLDLRWTDGGPQQVKNITRPIQVWRWSATGPAAPGAAETPPLPEKPSIAVLPFDNMSGDPEQEYFADGIAEDIITALSRFHWFFVIARNSSFSYKGSSPDVRQVGRELGVRYVLEGSVRKAGRRVRITAQLIEATTGRHLWAERYDRELGDIFAVQDEITEAITGAVAPSFVAAEERRVAGKGVENLDAWDRVMRGNWHLWRLTRDDFSKAAKSFRKAIEMSPESGAAHGYLALTLMMEVVSGWAEDPVTSRDLAWRAARRALAIDDQDALAHIVAGGLHHMSHDNEAAMKACRRALELNPNFAMAQGYMGLVSAHLGAADEADRLLAVARRQSPRDPSLRLWGMAPVISALLAERHEDYLRNAKEYTENAPDFVPGWRHLAAAYATLDRLEEAQDAIQRVLELAPNDRIGTIRPVVPIADAKARELYLAGLRKAGLPE